MTQGFDMGGGAYSRYETYPEQRQDGSVWEVIYDRETGAYATREVLPAEPPRRQVTRDDMMGAQAATQAPGVQAKRFSPLPEPPPPAEQDQYMPDMGTPGQSVTYAAPPTPPRQEQPYEGTSGNYADGNTYYFPGGTTQRYGLTGRQTMDISPFVPGQTKPGGTVMPPGYAQPRDVPAPTPQSSPRPNDSPQREAAADEWRNRGSSGTNPGDWVQTGPANWRTTDGRIERYYEKRADGSTALVTFDTGTGRYTSQDATTGAAVPNAGETGPRGSGGTPGRGGGGVDLREFTSNPANAAWWQEFKYQHQGMDPITYYQQSNNWYRVMDHPPTEAEALQLALADRAWGDALFRERGFAPTQSDWFSHYYNNSPAPYRGMASEYRGGPGDVGAYAGRGGNASGGGNWVDGPNGTTIWVGG